MDNRLKDMTGDRSLFTTISPTHSIINTANNSSMYAKGIGTEIRNQEGKMVDMVIHGLLHVVRPVANSVFAVKWYSSGSEGKQFSVM
jgi:hypothetical protein